MSEVINAIYEGNGPVRLEKEPEGVKPHERLAILIVPISVSKEWSPEKAGVSGLRQQSKALKNAIHLRRLSFMRVLSKGRWGTAGISLCGQVCTSYSSA